MATGKSTSSIRKNRKLVIVGDGMCGKTCLLFAFKDDRFIPSHDATIFDTYVADIQVDGKTVEYFDRFRSRAEKKEQWKFLSDRFGAVRHRRSRRLRSSSSTFLSRHERRADLFQRRQSRFCDQCHGEMASGSATFLWAMSGDSSGL